MQTNISDIKLKAAKPASKDYRIQIGGNTYLDVLSTGRKVWRMRFNDPATKKPAIYTFGNYPKIPLRDIGRPADGVKELVRQGINPTGQDAVFQKARGTWLLGIARATTAWGTIAGCLSTDCQQERENQVRGLKCAGIGCSLRVG